jgi:hypothetical protein
MKSFLTSLIPPVAFLGLTMGENSPGASTGARSSANATSCQTTHARQHR